MAETISVKPEIIRWAVARSGVPPEDLEQAFPKLDDWQSGERLPTFKQLETLAHKTMTPLGYFFLDTPPEEKLPIPDYRTVSDRPVGRPSPNLLETVQAMLRRQAWMRDQLIEQGQDELDSVASAGQSHNVVSVAVRIRERLGLDADWTDKAVRDGFAAAMKWVQAERQFDPDAKAQFASAADGWVIAYAKVNGLMVVTHEEYAPDVKR
jgi:hypothetical protein